MTTELLAPAGGQEALVAAVQSGADAVYMGFGAFNARRSARNFSDEEFRVAVSYCHLRGVKVYLTLNTLVTDRELPALAAEARTASECGVDAILVQDWGVLATLQKIIPDVPLHASTQMSLHTLSGVQEAARLGMTRAVLARELNREEIAEICQRSPIEIETFVHGALCMCYSGQCEMSAVIGRRSGNRGACAQPCRWRYHLTEEKRPGEYLPVYEDERGTYLYSAGDLCMIGHLDRLRDAGVASLKIEGRMKTAYYVATVVSAYRRALDLLEREGAEAYRRAVPELLAEVRKASHRTLTTGFYFGPPETPGGAEGFTQSMEYVGDVIAGAPDGGECLVRLKNRFYVGDALEVLTPAGPRAFTVSRMTLDTTGESVQTASVAGTLLHMPIPGGAGAGDLLRGPCRNHRSL